MLSFEQFAFSMEEDGTNGDAEDLTKMSDEELRKYADHHMDALKRESDEAKIMEHTQKLTNASIEGAKRFENLSKEEKIKHLHRLMKSSAGDIHLIDSGILSGYSAANSEEYKKAKEAFERGKKFRAAVKWVDIGSGVVGAGYLGYKALSHHKDQPSHENYLSWEDYVRGEYSF